MNFKHYPILSLLVTTMANDSAVLTQAAQATNIPACDTGPNALTDVAQYLFSGNSDIEIPQTCAEFGGRERCYYSYIPDSCNDSELTKAPVVVVTHGAGSCAAENALIDGWLQKAVEECIILLYPLGITDPNVADTSCFNLPGGIEYNDGNTTTIDCCCGFQGFPMLPEPQDLDTEFLRLIVQDSVAALKETNAPIQIHTQRIYFSGLSNGCLMSLAMAALHSDLVAAVACLAGSVVTPMAPDYTPVPIWLAHGTKDGSLYYEGNDFGFGLGLMPVLSGFEYLSTKNGCQQSSTLEYFNGTNSTITSGAGDCEAPVELLTLDEVGHVPYLGFPPLEPDAITPTVDTTALAWEFIRVHSKPSIPDLFQDTQSLEPSTSPPTASPSSSLRANASSGFSLANRSVVTTVVSLAFFLLWQL